MNQLPRAKAHPRPVGGFDPSETCLSINHPSYWENKAMSKPHEEEVFLNKNKQPTNHQNYWETQMIKFKPPIVFLIN